MNETDKRPEDGAQEESPRFADQMKQLSEYLETLKNAQDLEGTMKIYEQAQTLIRAMHQRLDEAELHVTQADKPWEN